MWERVRDPKHVHVATTKVPPDQRPAGQEGLCWALAVNPGDLIEGASLTTPCPLPAHHLGPHFWQRPPSVET